MRVTAIDASTDINALARSIAKATEAIPPPALRHLEDALRKIQLHEAAGIRGDNPSDDTERAGRGARAAPANRDAGVAARGNSALGRRLATSSELTAKAVSAAAENHDVDSDDDAGDIDKLGEYLECLYDEGPEQVAAAHHLRAISRFPPHHRALLGHPSLVPALVRLLRGEESRRSAALAAAALGIFACLSTFTAAHKALLAARVGDGALRLIQLEHRRGALRRAEYSRCATLMALRSAGDTLAEDAFRAAVDADDAAAGDGRAADAAVETVRSTPRIPQDAYEGVGVGAGMGVLRPSSGETRSSGGDARATPLDTPAAAALLEAQERAAHPPLPRLLPLPLRGDDVGTALENASAAVVAGARRGAAVVTPALALLRNLCDNGSSRVSAVVSELMSHGMLGTLVGLLDVAGAAGARDRNVETIGGMTTDADSASSRICARVAEFLRALIMRTRHTDGTSNSDAVTDGGSGSRDGDTDDGGRSCGTVAGAMIVALGTPVFIVARLPSTAAAAALDAKLFGGGDPESVSAAMGLLEPSLRIGKAPPRQPLVAVEWAELLRLSLALTFEAGGIRALIAAGIVPTAAALLRLPCMRPATLRLMRHIVTASSGSLLHDVLDSFTSVTSTSAPSAAAIVCRLAVAFPGPTVPPDLAALVLALAEHERVATAMLLGGSMTGGAGGGAALAATATLRPLLERVARSNDVTSAALLRCFACVTHGAQADVAQRVAAETEATIVRRARRAREGDGLSDTTLLRVRQWQGGSGGAGTATTSNTARDALLSRPQWRYAFGGTWVSMVPTLVHLLQRTPRPREKTTDDMGNAATISSHALLAASLWGIVARLTPLDLAGGMGGGAGAVGSPAVASVARKDSLAGARGDDASQGPLRSTEHATAAAVAADASTRDALASWLVPGITTRWVEATLPSLCDSTPAPTSSGEVERRMMPAAAAAEDAALHEALLAVAALALDGDAALALATLEERRIVRLVVAAVGARRGNGEVALAAAHALLRLLNHPKVRSELLVPRTSFECKNGMGRNELQDVAECLVDMLAASCDVTNAVDTLQGHSELAAAVVAEADAAVLLCLDALREVSTEGASSSEGTVAAPAELPMSGDAAAASVWRLLQMRRLQALHRRWFALDWHPHQPG